METGISRARVDRDATERFVPLRRMLGVTTFGLNQMVLEPGQRGRIHAHRRQEEVFLVLSGTLTLHVDGEAHELGPDDIVRIAPDVRRQVANLGRERVVLLALGGAQPHDGRDGIAFADWDDQVGGPPADIPLPPDVPVG